MTLKEDLRRDAIALIVYKQTLDHRVIVDDDPTEEEEVHLLRDLEEENKWTGYFIAENNAEKIYEVSYHYGAQKFYLTEYVMRECIGMDPKDILYSE